MADRIGGSFAPPLTKDLVKDYRQLSAKSDPQIRESVLKLCAMAEAYLARPAKTERTAGTPHPSGRGTIHRLSEEEVKGLWDVVPWKEENAMYAALFDKIDPKADKALRDAAHHLLWMAVELEKDREPLTTDML